MTGRQTMPLRTMTSVSHAAAALHLPALFWEQLCAAAEGSLHTAQLQNMKAEKIAHWVRWQGDQ